MSQSLLLKLYGQPHGCNILRFADALHAVCLNRNAALIVSNQGAFHDFRTVHRFIELHLDNRAEELLKMCGLFEPALKSRGRNTQGVSGQGIEFLGIEQRVKCARNLLAVVNICLLYTSDAADD